MKRILAFLRRWFRPLTEEESAYWNWHDGAPDWLQQPFKEKK